MTSSGKVCNKFEITREWKLKLKNPKAEYNLNEAELYSMTSLKTLKNNTSADAEVLQLKISTGNNQKERASAEFFLFSTNYPEALVCFSQATKLLYPKNWGSK